MAGHSKWANIKHRKERSDKLKGKIFSRIAKEIITAVKMGGPDPKSNPRLKLAIEKAKNVNFPNENIERNIKKASSGDQLSYDSVNYELYGYGGVGLIVEAMTDNKNRTASDMRIATNKRGGSIANPGSVSFNFDRKGVIQLEKNEASEEKIMAAAIDAGAEDFDTAEEAFMIITDPLELYAVKERLDKMGFHAKEAGFEMIPKTLVACDKESEAQNLALIEWLEEIDDVDAVYHNMDL